MKKYRIVMIVALLAALLSACSTKKGEPATEKSTENKQETVQPETRKPVIQILEETESAAAPETSAAAETPAAGIGGIGNAGTGADAAAKPESKAETKKETKAVKETEPVKVYSVEAFEKTMYATSSVNVRANYTTQSKVITSLSPGQKVKVTGKSANGWMRIIYNGKDAYVYQKYLSDSAPKASVTGPVPAQSQTAGNVQPEGPLPGSTSPLPGSTSPLPGSTSPTPGSTSEGLSPGNGNVTIVAPAPAGNTSGYSGTPQGPGASGGPGESGSSSGGPGNSASWSGGPGSGTSSSGGPGM